MGLAVVRSLRSPSRLTTPQESEDFEQELVDQYALAMVGGGSSDERVAGGAVRVHPLPRPARLDH
jgi:hypothetical protein